MDLEEAADQLYGLTPTAFTKRRAELSAQARREGAAESAKAISALRRPTVSAWLINQLVRDGQDAQHASDQHASDQHASSQPASDRRASDQLDQSPNQLAGPASQLMNQLRTLGAELRGAQARLDGGRMRELTQQRHELVAALVRRAKELAIGSGQKFGGPIQRELEESFGAAVADEPASLAVMSGRLTRALIYAGLGEVDVSAATATPVKRKADQPETAARPRATDKAPAARTKPMIGEARRTEARTEASKRADKSAEETRKSAEAARVGLNEAENDLAASARNRDHARADEARLSAELDELQRKILATRHELDRASRKAIAADRDHQRQERRARDARKALQRGERALAQLSRDGLTASDQQE